ncbi:MAG: hypothetical protein EXR64_05965, partial [Dehalococcoidia bacterium]|nr:hypothetical protein [Dehalococcoidia bacterium]
MRAARRGSSLLVLALLAVALTSGGWSLRTSAPPAPPRALLAIADLRGHALVLADTGDPARARRIPLAGGPHEIATLPGGRIVASLEQAGALAVVDVATGQTRTLEVGGLPHGVALGGDTLYVTDRSTDRLRRFSIADWHEGASLPAGAWPHAIVRLPDGALAVAHAADDTLSIGGRIVAVSHVPETIAAAPDGRVATAGSLGGAVQFFSAQGVLLATHDVGGRPVRVLFAPDGGTLAVALSADGAVVLLSGGATRRVEVGGV